jgi:hypothetical protein
VAGQAGPEQYLLQSPIPFRLGIRTQKPDGIIPLYTPAIFERITQQLSTILLFVNIASPCTLIYAVSLFAGITTTASSSPRKYSTVTFPCCFWFIGIAVRPLWRERENVWGRESSSYDSLGKAASVRIGQHENKNQRRKRCMATTVIER